MKKFIILFSIMAILTLGSVEENDTDPIEVRSDNNFPPYEFLENEVPVGFNIDIMYAATEAVGIQVHHKSDVWETLRAEIESGEVDMLTGMFQSEARESVVDFTTPILVLSHSIFVRDGSTIQDIDDARGKTILVQKDDITEDYVIENNISDHIIGFENKEDALKALESGVGDFALLSRVNAFYLMDKNEIKNVVEVGPEVFKVNFCFAVAEGDAELLSLINEGLSIIKSNGTYDEIYDKWFSVYEKRNIKNQVLRVILWIISPISIIAITVLLWSYSLKKQVNNKTKEIININDHLEEMVYERTRELAQTHTKLLETEKDSMFSELVLGVSHEMNTPLGNIMTLITYQTDLKHRLSSALNSDQLRRDDLNTYLEKTKSAEIEVKKSLDEIIKMINIFKSLDIKNLNKITSFNMYNLILKSQKYVLMNNQDKTLEFNIECNKNSMITGYSDALFQVMQGLIENSIVHGFSNTEEGSIDISFTTHEDENELIVQDNGKGMSEHTLTHIFDYFFSEDKRFGIGLGLNRTHNIIHFLLEGTIEIESTLNVGTSVVIKWHNVNRH